ncbi:hypothetical protein [Hoylesella enoeca]|uniref:hypothetical protein n=1 Tax=Hoylesella enoeca TaxID=76123 RepID=UPI0005600677|nr:hypothetical protein [Hoylesella enoeca]
MNRKQLERWAYAKPAVETIRLEPHSELMDTSFPSQHNPGHHAQARAVPNKVGLTRKTRTKASHPPRTKRAFGIRESY